MQACKSQSEISVHLKVREFAIPPVRDCLVVGRKSPVACVALLNSIALRHGEPFDDLRSDDALVSNVLVRGNVLKKISGERLVALVLRRVKPLMGEVEVMQLDVEAEISLEDIA